MLLRKLQGHHSAQQWVGFGKAAWSVLVGSTQGIPGPLGGSCALQSCQESGEDLGYVLVFLFEKGKLRIIGVFLAPRGFNFALSTFRYLFVHPSIHLSTHP